MTRKVLLLSVSLVVLLLAFSREGVCLPQGEVETYYWPNSMPASEWTFSNSVGYRIITCGGSRHLEGVVTQNLVSFSSGCGGGTGNMNCSIDGFATSCSLVSRVAAIVCSSSLYTCT